MKIKPAKNRGKVLVEVGSRDSALLAEESLLQMKSVLVPIDFSAASFKALQYAIAFAKQFHAEVLILHVTEFPMGAVGAAEGGIAISEGLIEDMAAGGTGATVGVDGTNQAAKRGGTDVDTDGNALPPNR